MSTSAPLAAAAPAEPQKKQRRPVLSMAAWRQFIAVAKPYWTGSDKRAAWLLLGLLIVLMICETQLAVMLNDKTGEMTSALAAHEGPRFWAAVRASLLVLAFAVPIYAFYYYMRDAFANRWRRWLTGRFLDGYLGERRYYALGGGDIDNPDQRISEDINTFTGRSIHFLLIFLGSAMQLVAFSAVLWSISHTLVAFLAIYAIAGTIIALAVFGTPLILLNYWQLRREADFRFSLMRVRENAESIAFYRGEAQERAQVDQRFTAAYENFKRMIRKQRSLNLFQRGFSQLTLVLPNVILAGGVLSGELEVGRAVQAAGAFMAVLSAVSVIVDNFESLSRFVAGIGRLNALSQAVLATSQPAGTPEEQRIVTKAGDRIELAKLCVGVPRSKRMLVHELDLALEPGSGLLITGPSGCGKSSLLRVIAGLWSSGSGQIRTPPPEALFFLPQKPYIQPGSLRSQLAYPGTHTDLDDERLLQILREAHLPELAERAGGLDAEHDWDKLLSTGEQQRLAFARVLVHKPSIVLLDEATSALDSRSEAALYKRLREDGITLISVAHRASVLRYHTHVLELSSEDGRWHLHAAERYRFED